MSDTDTSPPADGHVSDREIWDLVGLLIERHRELAPIEAAKQADECLESGDFVGQRFWQRVTRAAASMTELANGSAH